MRHVRKIKLAAVVLFAAAGFVAFLAGGRFAPRALAYSSGPPAGHTGAQGEFTCKECHLPDGAPTGSITITTPQSYVAGQTYPVTVSVANADPSRLRWGFQLTAVDDTGNRAGTLQPGADGRTQVIAGSLGSPARQYVEHTASGTFQGQANGASWTFSWTAPAEAAGPVLFHAAANQANGDFNTSGDAINFTFTSVQPAAAQPDFTVTVTPSSQVVVPNSTGSYSVTVTPANGFAGTVALNLAAGVPPGANFSFSPAAVQITDASPRTSTLTFSPNAHTPLGSFPVTVTATGAGLTRTASFTLVTGPTMLDPGLAIRAVTFGLNQPTSLAFVGADDFLVLEKATGRVLRVKDGALQAAPVLDLAVNSNSERGLLGIALHPNFPANPRAYLYWTESSTGADSANADEVPLAGNRVDSFLWNGSTLTLEKNLIKLRSLQQDAGQPSRGNHNGGVLRFGPDSKLYVVFGDQGRRGLLQNLRFGPSASPNGPTTADDQFGGPEPDNNHLSGVVLRLNDDGTTPADNPFFNVNSGLTGEAAANVKKVFAYGVRNSFGMAFDPVSGYLWTQENGDDAFDEINRVAPGFDGGWIQLMGPSSRVAEFKQIEVARGNSLQQNRWTPDRIADTPAEALARLFVLPGSRYTEPEFSWKYAVAPSPVGFVRGRALGPGYEGDLLVGASRTTLAGGYLFRFKLSNDRRHLSFADARLADLVADNADKFDATESESLMLGRDFGITTDIQTAPNGNVYVVSNTNGSVYEISAAPSTVQFGSATYQVAEGGGSATVTVTRAGATSSAVSVDYRTVDNAAPVPCADTTTQPGTAFARCDYATTVDTLTFAPGETTKTISVPVINDAHVEGNETFQIALSNPSGTALGAQATAAVTITDDDSNASAPNPLLNTQFFVRQQYLDFLSREPEAGEPWSSTLNNCPAGDVRCDRVQVSVNFFGSHEFQLKGFFVYRFYKLTLGRQPAYSEFVADMRSVTGATPAEVFAKKAAFTNAWVQRPQFKAAYDALTNQQFVDALMNRYALQSVTAPDPASPDGATKVTLTRADLVARLNEQSLTRAQVVRAVADSDELFQREFNPAFVTMQYFGYLRRDPEEPGYTSWLDTLNANPGNYRTMVSGFLNSREYQLRFGQPF